MKASLLSLLAISLAASCCVALGQSGPGPGGGGGGQGDMVRDQDRLQTCSPDLDQKRTRLHGTLPGEVTKAVQDMKQARERYQRQIQDKKKEMNSCTEQERTRLREQLRETIKDQTRDREQLRERLQALRDSVPTHDQVMDAARERTRDRDLRGR